MYNKGSSFCLPFLFKFQCKRKQRTLKKKQKKVHHCNKTDKHVQHTCAEGKNS